MCTIGIDLGISSRHLVVIADERGNAISSVISLNPDPEEMERLLRRAREETGEKEPIRVVMEPTGLSWLPIASYFCQREVMVYLVNTQQTADLRKYYSKHAKSDRISAEILCSLPVVNPGSLHPIQLSSADYLSGQRWCKQQERLAVQILAIKNRVQASERAFWPGLEEAVGNTFSTWMMHWRERWYDPWVLQSLDCVQLQSILREVGAPIDQIEILASGLKRVADRAIGLFGTPQGETSLYLNYQTLQDEILRDLRLLATLENEHHEIRQKVHQLYQQMYPSRHLESIQGVGKDGAAVYFFFVGEVERFALQKEFRSWSGMVPKSNQSGDTEKKGLHLTKAGPDLVKKYAYLNAEVARQWDPQFAAIYYDQMMNKGRHHHQAICCCATHLLDRVRAVLRDERPYQLRDVDGSPITWQQARSIVIQQYHVPDQVRQRRNHHNPRSSEPPRRSRPSR